MTEKQIVQYPEPLPLHIWYHPYRGWLEVVAAMKANDYHPTYPTPEAATEAWRSGEHERLYGKS